ncbi:hypothetical protein COD10_04125 [Bacillus thuringiensis]|uniref:DoxX n=1 Tax=Bacillus thuringiensis TaxID=1428 RepID=A0A9X6TT76_BACTU|nr:MULTISPECIES: hypothetical protein [Bacillus]AND09564.1 hypothetical protein Bt4C1_20840 [Bacillus thuringiensis serovar alesti]AQY40705.1 hypothetical protein B4918_23355 [Bacillus thuringiensis]KAB2391884.1 hypothetical protein F8171_23345 [Bacillus cereus]MCP1320012.1 hypothetical protein [Bacillus sp. S0628]MDO6633207.1 hypothetical protein [Bacillus thuringiensis]
MKYTERDFTLELKEKIQCMEKEIERISLKLYKEYSHLYIEKNMELDMGFAREKENPFEVGYYSSVAIAILDEEKEMIGFYNIPIWKCERIFLGMPIQSNILGSKKVGELADESCYEIEEELKEQLKEYLE